MAGIDRFRNTMVDAVPDEDGILTIDCSGLTFIDSSGIAALLGLAERLGPSCLILHGVHGGPRKVLGIAGLARHPRIHILECRNDPFPSGARLDQPFSRLSQRLSAMRETYLASLKASEMAWERSSRARASARQARVERKAA